MSLVILSDRTVSVIVVEYVLLKLIIIEITLVK